MTTAKGLCGLGFGDEDEEAAMLADMKATLAESRLSRKSRARPRRSPRRIFEAPNGEVQPLHLLGTQWQIKVWQALLEIPSGKVATYKSIAEKVCDAKASRAVGTAVGRNPISWLIPCHRVLGSDGALHGYHWGLTANARCSRWKRQGRLSHKKKLSLPAKAGHQVSACERARGRVRELRRAQTRSHSPLPVKPAT